MHSRAVLATDDLVADYFCCPYRAYLSLSSEKSEETDYQKFADRLEAAYRSKALRHLTDKYGHKTKLEIDPSAVHILANAREWILTSSIASSNKTAHPVALKRVSGRSRLGDCLYTPVRCCPVDRVRRQERLLLAYNAIVLGDLQGKIPDYGFVMYGPKCRTTRVPLKTLLPTASRAVDAVLVGILKHPPALVLNKSCPACRFHSLCKSKAIEEDNLSLLGAIGEKELLAQHRKGIFTVTQLSYTFRPRRKNKRTKASRPRHYPALKARSIRENKIHVHGSPKLPAARMCCYLDIETLPDTHFTYLIGLVAEDGRRQRRYQFWADNQDEQKSVILDFVRTVRDLGDCCIYHYGRHDAKTLARGRSLLPSSWHHDLDSVSDKLCDIFTIVHHNVYFPTYTDGLKEIARYLGYSWSDPNASGLQSILWRYEWERTRDPVFKDCLFQYNYEDCMAAKRLTEFIRNIVGGNVEKDPSAQSECVSAEIVRTVELQSPPARGYAFGNPTFAIADLDYINKCAYFDYQRERVVARAGPHRSSPNRKTAQAVRVGNRRLVTCRPSRTIKVDNSQCPQCGSTHTAKAGRRSKTYVDLKSFRYGMKRWVTRYVTSICRCSACGKRSLPSNWPQSSGTYGHGLKAFCTYQNVARGQLLPQVRHSLGDLFQITLSEKHIYNFRSYMAEFYRPAYDEIHAQLLDGPVIHADETKFDLRTERGYVWVLANRDNVYFCYRNSREATVAEELLGGFSGVLVSDFYAAYDSIPCSQQKCLIHLVRDLNDELLKNAYNEEFKRLVAEFAGLLKAVVATIDERGLRARYLRRHKRAVGKFFKLVRESRWQTDVACKFARRFLKNREKLFVFLDCDDVPWNNNCAEHAIQRFAKYRATANGRNRESALSDYLVLLSVALTCEYRGANVLRFLISGERSLRGYEEEYTASGNRRRRSRPRS